MPRDERERILLHIIDQLCLMIRMCYSKCQYLNKDMRLDSYNREKLYFQNVGKLARQAKKLMEDYQEYLEK